MRLKTGRRFFSAARCPSCGDPLDRTRLRRVIRFWKNLRRPVSDRRPDHVLWTGALAVTVATVVGAAIFRGSADLWWPATVMLYGPRWVVLLPVIGLSIFAVVRDPALLAPLAFSAVILLGPVMGFRLGLSALWTQPSDTDIRVGSLNAGGDAFDLFLGADELMDAARLDVLMVQECAGRFRRSIREVDGWYTSVQGPVCVVSRFPIGSSERMDRTEFLRAGGSALMTTFELDVDGRIVYVTNIHLETPRAGLELIRAGRIREGAEVLRQKSVLREIELRRAAQWAGEQGRPALVLGDFNTPPESRHLRRYWSDWTDAFAHVGWGIGATRLNGWIRARIDYVMADDNWTVVEAKVGPDVGSDHLPIVAQVRLKD